MALAQSERGPYLNMPWFDALGDDQIRDDNVSQTADESEQAGNSNLAGLSLHRG